MRVGDHFVRVLTMKEAITETRPLVLDSLLKVTANFYVVTEWTPMTAEQARKEVNKRRRHFNVSKTGFISQMGTSDALPAFRLPILRGPHKERWSTQPVAFRFPEFNCIAHVIVTFIRSATDFQRTH